MGIDLSGLCKAAAAAAEGDGEEELEREVKEDSWNGAPVKVKI